MRRRTKPVNCRARRQSGRFVFVLSLRRNFKAEIGHPSAGDFACRAEYANDARPSVQTRTTSAFKDELAMNLGARLCLHVEARLRLGIMIPRHSVRLGNCTQTRSHVALCAICSISSSLPCLDTRLSFRQSRRRKSDAGEWRISFDCRVVIACRRAFTGDPCV